MKRPAAVRRDESEPVKAPDPEEKRKGAKGVGLLARLLIGVSLAALGLAGWAYYKYRLAPPAPYVWDEFGVPDGKVEIFTKESLATAKERFDENPDSNPILLSIAGHVFDVTNGRQFYGPGGGYEFFAFTDASKAFTTGKFEEDLTDDLTGLDHDQCRGVYRWLTFFKNKHPKYVFKGRLAGTFFTKGGEPTPAFKQFLECAGADKGQQDEDVVRTDKFPYGLNVCSTRWARDEGHSVWCSKGDQVPRRVVHPADDTSAILKGPGRCVCVDVDLTVERVPDGSKLVLYPECDPTSQRCSF